MRTENKSCLLAIVVCVRLIAFLEKGKRFALTFLVKTIFRRNLAPSKIKTRAGRKKLRAARGIHAFSSFAGAKDDHHLAVR